MDSFIFFTLGTFVGSFFNVVIYRMPLGESIIKPRSHCPACKTSIPFYRNIPLVSFILQAGKCANCQVAISLQYPAVELINGLIWGWAFYTLPFPDAVTASFL
nr:prepilin peptidase [Candidatus Neomarinimicrobiota bacterium]